MLVHFHSSFTVCCPPFIINGLSFAGLSVFAYRQTLFLVIDPFHPRRNAGKDFVRNRIQLVGENRYRQVVTENNRLVTFAAVDVGHVYHTDVHTDIAHIRRFLSVHQAIGISPSQVAVQSVGITDRNGGDT